MPYTTPQFNVPVDVWSAGHVPSDDDPDFENVASQFYVYSRVSYDVQPCELELYQPPIQVRMPTAAVTPWTAGQVFEVPAESGRYYRARFKDRLHLGFPNEYLVIFVVQCGADGVPVLRDIEGAEPCGGPAPPMHNTDAAGQTFQDVTGEATAQNISGGGEHETIGEGAIEGDVEGDGEANQEEGPHETEGDGPIAGAVDGEGEAERIT